MLQEAMQHQRAEVALCLLRVIFVSGLTLPTPVTAALTEDLVLGLLLRQQSSASKNGEADLTRQGSYTEMQLGAPVPHDEVGGCALALPNTRTLRPLECRCTGCRCAAASMFGHESQGYVVNAHRSQLMQQQTVRAMVLLAAKLGTVP